MSSERPSYDHARAAAMVGKYVLVGLTDCDHEGKVIGQRQLHGRILSADPKDGFAIELKGVRDGETYWLPPDTSSFHDAAPGEYRLQSTGEVIVDPDLLTTWTVGALLPAARPAEPGSQGP